MGPISQDLEYFAEAVKGVAVHNYMRHTSVRSRTGQYPPVFVTLKERGFHKSRAQYRWLETRCKLGNSHDRDRSDQDVGVNRRI